jgi:hypothetical protein
MATATKAKSAKPKVHELSLDQIIDDTLLQPRKELDASVLGEYMNAWLEDADFPPVVTFFDGSHYWLADGFHRVRSARSARKSSIRAYVYNGNKRDAIFYSAGANAEHGLRRSNEDKKRAVLKLLDDPQWCLWTDAEIAKVCRVSAHTVGRYRTNSPGVRGHDISLRVGSNGSIFGSPKQEDALAEDAVDSNGVEAEVFLRPPTPMSKAEITDKFLRRITRHLKASDSTVQTNAACEFGTIEIVSATHAYTFTTIYERDRVFTVVGRMILLVSCLAPNASIVIVGHFPKGLSAMIGKYRSLGIDFKTPEQILAE